MVSFFIYDMIFLVLFSLFVVVFLYKRRKNLKREGILFLYRTKIGLKVIDYVGGKYKRTLKFLQYPIIILSYVLMILMTWMLINVLKLYMFSPQITEFFKAPPLLPLVPYITSTFDLNSFLPPLYFTYWIISILVIAIVHEFAHGIYAKYYGVKIKSTGFGFLGPLLAAFVEPDEKALMKKSNKQQLSVLGAGVFANVITAIIFFFLIWGFFSIGFVESGAMFSSYSYNIIHKSNLTNINGVDVTIDSAEGLIDSIDDESFVEVNYDYVLKKEDLVRQIESDSEYMQVFHDLPAVRNDLKGVIVEVDGVEIKNQEDLTVYMKERKVGEEIILRTIFDDEEIEYKIELGKDPNNEERAVLGITSTKNVKRILESFAFFKNPGTYYESRVDGITIFIYYLLWWIFLINVAVALFNALPIGIVDGGRIFYITMLSLTKSKKFAEKSYKIVTWFFILLFFAMMWLWVRAL
ncbi:MAG: site-2 protease family protein [Nanoarchaeota archaeon]|nr:site-2 protease family protein [Nanoarchaeota archaeon]